MKAIVNKKFNRPAEHWLEKFKDIPPSIVSDCLNRYYAIGGEIKPILNKSHMVGFAVTIQAMPGSNLMSHYALTIAKPGDILVIDARGCLGNAVWGEVQASFAVKQGVAGLVVDGAIRDVDAMRKLKFPVYCKGITPGGPHKGWADNVNLPVQCGGVPVNPGDLIIGDDDGVVVLPQNYLEEVYHEAQKRMKLEKEWHKKMENGESSLDAVGLRKVLDNMDVVYIEKN